MRQWREKKTSKKLKLNNQRENKSYEYTKQEQQTIKSKFREKNIFFPIRTYLWYKWIYKLGTETNNKIEQL